MESTHLLYMDTRAEAPGVNNQLLHVAVQVLPTVEAFTVHGSKLEKREGRMSDTLESRELSHLRGATRGNVRAASPVTEACCWCIALCGSAGISGSAARRDNCFANVCLLGSVGGLGSEVKGILPLGAGQAV